MSNAPDPRPRVAERESVWDYPRPPRLESSRQRIEVSHQGFRVARTSRALRILETSHPPVYYIPRTDINMELLERSAASSYCEFKGQAEYFDLILPEARAAKVAWSYSRPAPEYDPIAGYLAFYPSRVDECRIDGERVRAQAGDFYGGWITSHITGPFKGGSGTEGW